MAKKHGGETSVVADGNFTLIGEARTDSKKRVVLKGKVARHYYAYQNDAGQILLEPMVMLPARQARRSKDSALISALRESVQQAREGKLVKMRSLAKHVDERLDD
jgi:hypothetical protein